MENIKSVELSWRQLAEHNKEGDAWLAIRGQVYDVTSWVNAHPGGKDTILLNSGRDATQLFEAYHPVWVSKTLERYRVGSLIDSEHPTFPPMSEFYLTLKQRVESHFKTAGVKHTQGTRLLLTSVVLIFVCLASWLGAVYAAQASLLLGVAFAVGSGVGMALLSLIPVHEGSHAALTSSPWTWRFMGAIHDFINGCSFYMWCHQHFLGHHPFTNVAEADPDVHTNDPVDFRRIKAEQPWYSHYRLQHLYAPVLYGLLATKFRINDIQIMFFLGENGKIRVNPTGPWHWSMFILGKLFWVTYRIIIPSFYLPLGHVFALVMASDLVASYYLALMFQVNHVVAPAIWPKVNKKTGMIDMDWAKLQVMTTIDYAHGSWLTTFLSGALNHQVVHHLFPNISQTHYPEIAPIVRRTCEEYEVPYVVLPSFWVALKAHLHYLMVMGGAPDLH